MEVNFGIPFLTISKVEVDFVEKKLTWKDYTITKALPTTKRVQTIDPKKFVKVVLDSEQEAFVVHITIFFVEPVKVHLNRKVKLLLWLLTKFPLLYWRNIQIFRMSFLKNLLR